MPLWYYLLSGFFLLDTMQAFGFIDRLVYGPFSPGSDVVTQGLNLLMIGATFVLFARGSREGFKGLVSGSVLAFLAVGFLWLSSFWSLEPATSSRVAIIYFYVILGAIGIASTMHSDEFINLLSWSCFMAAIASLLMAIAFPAIQFAGSVDGLDFRGIFTHKNVLGQVMATGALATLHSIRVARRSYRANFAFYSCYWEWRTHPSRRERLWPAWFSAGSAELTVFGGGVGRRARPAVLWRHFLDWRSVSP